MVLGDFKFLGVPCHSIELDDLKVFMADDGSAKRIHFATSHAHALRKDSRGKPFAWFNVPFRNTIEPLMKKELGSSNFALFLSKTTDKPFRMVLTKRSMRIFLLLWANIRISYSCVIVWICLYLCQ